MHYAELVKFVILLITFFVILVAYFLYYHGLKTKKYVNENSIKIKKLIALNNEFGCTVIEDLFLEKVFHNKKSFDQTSPRLFLQKVISHDVDYYHNLICQVENNLKSYYKYYLSYAEIAKIETNLKVENKPYFKKVEERLLKNLKLNPKLDFLVTINIKFVSANGKNNLQKEQKFTYNQFKQNFILVLGGLIQKETKIYNSKVERAKLTMSLRYKIFCKDDFKCQICGRSAKDGAILHIDHIIPISKGGRTEIDNLRTLCQSCNLGKGSSVLKPADVVKTDSLSKLKAMLENIE